MSHFINSKINKNKSRTPIVVDDDYCITFKGVQKNKELGYHGNNFTAKGVSIVKKNIISQYDDEYYEEEVPTQSNDASKSDKVPESKKTSKTIP
jgi:hypothetical protein